MVGGAFFSHNGCESNIQNRHKRSKEDLIKKDR